MNLLCSGGYDLVQKIRGLEMVTSGPERQHSGEGACLACYHGSFQALAEDIHEPHQVTGEGKKVTLSGGKDLEKDWRCFTSSPRDLQGVRPKNDLVSINR